MKYFVNLVSYTESGWIEVDATSELHAQEQGKAFKTFVPCVKRRWDIADVCRPNKRGEPEKAGKNLFIKQTAELCETGD